MNPDIKKTEYIAKLKDVKLSDIARVRIQANLQEYAVFHTVRDAETVRFIGVVPKRTSLFIFKFAYMPLIIVLAIMIGGGTTFAAQASIPGDFLYPVKIAVNENIREALAMSADSEAKLQANLLEERLEEAQKLQVKGQLTADTETSVVANISAQAKQAEAAADKSSANVKVETKAKIVIALKNFLSTTSLDSALAAQISPAIATAMVSSDLATGLYDIAAYRADMTARTKALANVMQKHQSKIQAGTYVNLNLKVDAATKLTVEAQTQAEAEARVTLDKAATLTGEVESKLSTLGQVEIDSNSGMITNINFSIDPMIIDRGDGKDATKNTSTSHATGTGQSLKIDTKVKGSLDSDILDTTVDADATVSSGVNVGR